MQNFTSEMFSLLGYTKEVLDNVKMPLPPVDDRNSSGIVGELNDFEKDCLKILAKIEKEHIVFHEKNSILGTDETVSEHDAILLKSDFSQHRHQQ